MANQNKIRLTAKDVESRREELNRLVEHDRDETLAAMKEAQSHGDLSENAEYSSAKEKLAEIDARIDQIRFELENYELVELNDNIYDVIITNPDGKQREIHGLTIGGSVDFDLSNSNIPLDSPLAVALKDTVVGSEVAYRVGEGRFTVVVTAISLRNN